MKMTGPLLICWSLVLLWRQPSTAGVPKSLKFSQKPTVRLVYGPVMITYGYRSQGVKVDAKFRWAGYRNAYQYGSLYSVWKVDVNTELRYRVLFCQKNKNAFLCLSSPNAMHAFIKAQTETQVTLEWRKVKNHNYILRYSNGTEIPLPVSSNGSVIRYTISSLSPGTKYHFDLYAVVKGVKRSAFNLVTVTRPSNVANVSVRAHSETAITFGWRKVNNNNAYIYILKRNRSESYTPMYWAGTEVAHTVPFLRPGTKYYFTLYTVFGGVRSRGYNFSAATRPLNVARVNITQQLANQLQLSWEKVQSNNYSYILRDTSTRTETGVSAAEGGSVVMHTVSSLSPATRYRFTLYTVFEGVRSRGLTFTSLTASRTVNGLRCEQLPGGNALAFVWDPPSEQWTGVEVQLDGRGPQYLNGTRLEFHDLLPALWYNATLKLYSGGIKSAPVSISCQTDPRGLIAGVVLVLLFMGFLLCVGIVTHRLSTCPSHHRNTQPDLHTNQTSSRGEDAACNSHVQDTQHPDQRLKGKKCEDSSVENPYAAPGAPPPATREEGSDMMVQMRS